MIKLFVLVVSALVSVTIIDAASGAFDSITNSSSSQDVLNVVSSLKNGNLDAGADEVLKELHEVIQNQIKNLDGIDGNGKCKNYKSMFDKLLKSINRNLNQHLDENHPAKSVFSFLALKTDKFLQNVTKTVYETADILEELSHEFKTNNSVDTDTFLSVIVIIYDKIINEIQNYDEKIVETLKKLLNANSNSETIVDVIVKAEHDLSDEIIGVQTGYYIPLQDGKNTIKDVASGKKTISLDEVIKNLKSISNSKKTTHKEAKSVLRDVNRKLKGKSFTIDDLINAIKADKPSEVYSILQMRCLKKGSNLLSGVNDISNSEVLQNIVDSLKKKDHKELLSGIAGEFNQTSGIFKNLLADTLKGQILTIKNPSLASVFQLEFDYYAELENDGLRKARELVETGHPKDSECESKKASSSGSGEKLTTSPGKPQK